MQFPQDLGLTLAPANSPQHAQTLPPPPSRGSLFRRLGGTLLSCTREGRIFLPLLVLLTAGVLTLITLRDRQVSRDHEAMVMARAAERAESLSSLLKDALGATLGQIAVDHRLARLMTEARLAGNPAAEAALRMYLTPDVHGGASDIAAVSAVGADGFLLWSTVAPSMPQIDMRDREQVSTFSGRSIVEHFIGRPILSRTTGEWVVPNAMAVRDAAGTLLATTHVLWRINTFVKWCGNLGLRPADRVMVIRDDGLVLMTNIPGNYGWMYPAPRPETGDALRTWTGAGLSDGETRYFASRHIPGSTLTVQVALSLAAQRAALADLRQQQFHSMLWLDAAALLITFAGATIFALRRRSGIEAVRNATIAQAEAWLRGVMDQQSHGILVFDHIERGDFRVAFANRRAVEITGFQVAALIGQSGDLMVHPDDKAERSRRVKALMGGGSTDEATYRLIRSDGRVIWIRTSTVSSPQPGTNSGLRAISSFYDVTAERERDAALQQARAELDRVLAVAPGVFYRLTSVGTGRWQPTFISESVHALFGIGVAAAMQPGFVPRLTGLDLSAARFAALARATGGPALLASAYCSKLNGKEIWLHDTARVTRLPDGSGEVVGFLVDATELHTAQAGREAAERDFRAAVQLGPGLLYHALVTAAGIEVLSVDGDIARVTNLINNNASDLADLRAILEDPGHLSQLRQIADNSDSVIEYSVAPSGGTPRWLRNSVRVTARSMEGIEVVGYLADMTREMAERLRGQQVTTLLTLGEMATGIAHELNQPLSSISFAAQNLALLLGRDVLDRDVIAAKLNRIEQETRRASGLVDQMRIFAGTGRPNSDSASWRAALTAAVQLLRPGSRGCDVRDDLPDDLPNVSGVAIALEQVLIALLTNAMDAYDGMAAARPRTVTVRGWAARGEVVVQVVNQASGIPASVLPRVFEPFFTTKQIGKGTGLGLALAFGAVTAMSGTITVANIGGGATFEIRLPAFAEAAQ